MVRLANPQPATKTVPLHLLWAAMEKIGKKELDSDKIEDGTSHTVSLNITGNIDGEFFNQSIESLVTVGHQQTKTSSVNPQVPELLAWVLSKLNPATQNRILADIPSEFAENGGMPKSDATLVNEAKQLLKQLRQSKSVTARGPVQCKYVLGQCEAIDRCPCKTKARIENGLRN
jgi:hypothetical protein